MKDKFGSLREDEGESRSREQELRGEAERKEDQLSDRFKEQQERVEENRRREREVQRERELRRDTDEDDYSFEIGSTEMDWAIDYELDENYDFHVKQDGQLKKVPVIWDNQERWTWARKNLDLKSVKEKVLLPLIVIDRTDFSDNPGIRSQPHLNTLTSLGRTVTGVQRYSSKNRYDNFTVLNGRKPVKEFQVSQVPEYVRASYDITVFTEYRWQMDKITDALKYRTGQYWGDEDKNLFYANFDSIDLSVEMSDETRYVEASISLDLDGFVVPKNIPGENTSEKKLGPAKVEVIGEVVEGRRQTS